MKAKNDALEKMIQKLCEDNGLVDPRKVPQLTSYDINDPEKYQVISHHAETNYGSEGGWGGCGNEKTHQLLNGSTGEGDKWYSTQRAND